MDRIEIYRAFAARSTGGAFSCSWTREAYPLVFDAINQELDAMDEAGLIRCVLRHRARVVTALLSKAGLREFRAAVKASPTL